MEQPRLQIFYKGGALTKVYIPDFFAFDGIVLELKAARALSEMDSAQILNTLRASRMRVGLLMNFGEPSLTWKRFVHYPTPRITGGLTAEYLLRKLSIGIWILGLPLVVGTLLWIGLRPSHEPNVPHVSNMANPPPSPLQPKIVPPDDHTTLANPYPGVPFKHAHQELSGFDGRSQT